MHAVDADHPVSHLHTRHVVRKRGPQSRTGLDQLRLCERRMQRVGGPQQLHQRTRRDSALLLALDHGGAHHEHMLRTWHHVEREARMQQPDRTRQGQLGAAQQQHLATHAAQPRQQRACGKTAAVDDMVERFRHPIRAEQDTAAECLQLPRQRRQRQTRVQMRLMWEEQRLAEATREIRLECCDTVPVEPFMLRRTPTETGKLAHIALRRDHQAAAPDRAGSMAEPPFDGPLRLFQYLVRRRLRLAPGGQHAARLPRRPGPDLLRLLDQGDGRSPLGQQHGGHQPGNPTPLYQDARPAHEETRAGTSISPLPQNASSTNRAARTSSGTMMPPAPRRRSPSNGSANGCRPCVASRSRQ